MPRTIHDLLKDWGQKRRQSPARNDILKAEILAKHRPSADIVSVPRRIPWLSLAFTGLAAVVLFVNALTVNYTPQSLMTSSPTGVVEEQSFGGWAVLAPNSVVEDVREKLLNPRAGPPPVTDNREFLKTDYNAQIRTRRVSELTQRIQTIVRGMNGRVDSASGSETYGYVSFVIPASKLETFKTEIRSLVRAKFYSEQLYSQNLLPQKQIIEQDEVNALKTLSDLASQREKLIADHNRLIVSYQSRINAISKEITALNAEFPLALPERQLQIIARITDLQNEKQGVQSLIASENRNHKIKLDALEAQTKIAEDNLAAINKQDQDLLDNVATVQGYINLSWISLWDIADLYLPGPLVTWILGTLAVAAYLWHRRRSPLIIA